MEPIQVPSKDELRSVLLDEGEGGMGNMIQALAFATSSMPMIRALQSLSQALSDYRIQIEALDGDKDPLSLLALEAHAAIETAFERALDAGHALMEHSAKIENRRMRARMN